MYYLFTSKLPYKEEIKYKLLKKEDNKLYLDSLDGSCLIIYKMIDGISIKKETDDIELLFKLSLDKQTKMYIKTKKDNLKMEFDIKTKKMNFEDDLYEFEYDLLDNQNCINSSSIMIKGVKDYGD